MNAYPDWNCDACGKRMTPGGDCPSCEKKEKERQIAEGEIKRAKDIVVGDVISPRFSFKINAIHVHSVEITSKGKVIVNKGMGWTNECTFESMQWVDICKQTTRDTKCFDDSCDLIHCARCGSHMMGAYLEPGTICDSCRMAEEQKFAEQVTCRIHQDQERVDIYRGATNIGYVSSIGGRPSITLLKESRWGIEAHIAIEDLEIVLDNWNQMQEFIREGKAS